MTNNGDNRSATASLDRRSYLKGAFSVAGAAALAMTGAAAEDDYDVIEVGPGETFTKSLSQGETWENKIIDITADGAGYFISNSGSSGNWTIRNIGVRGQWDHDPGSQAIVLDVEDPNESALIENVYLGDGAVNTDARTDPGGIFIHGEHAGTITIRNVNVQGWGDNGIYGSDPGTSHSGEFGEVHLENVYAANNGTSGFRLGTENSSATNCVAWNNDRGMWCLFEHIHAENCDMGNNGHDIRVGSNSQEDGYINGELTVDNVRYKTTDIVRSANAIHGSSAGTPQHRGPEDIGAPTSPEAAASGSNEGSTSPEPEPPEDAHLVAFITEPDAAYAEYELVVEGDIVPTEASYESPSGGLIAAHRETVEETDGVSRVASLTGGGNGDAYEVYGSVRSVTVDQPDAMWIELDGEEVTEDELVSRTGGEPGGDSVEGSLETTIVETNDPAGGERFTLTASVENPGDTVAEGDVRLLVGSGAEEVDAVDVSLEGGAAETVTLGYETYPVQQEVEFPVRVETDDDAAEQTVAVSAATDGSLDVSIDGTNDPVRAGADLTVDVRVQNGGSTDAAGTVRLLVGSGGDEVDAVDVSLEGGAAETVTLGYETYPVQQDVQFPVRVETEDGSDDRTVEVYGLN